MIIQGRRSSDARFGERGQNVKCAAFGAATAGGEHLRLAAGWQAALAGLEESGLARRRHRAAPSAAARLLLEPNKVFSSAVGAADISAVGAKPGGDVWKPAPDEVDFVASTAAAQVSADSGLVNAGRGTESLPPGAYIRGYVALQGSIGKRDVKNAEDDDLIEEPELIRSFHEIRGPGASCPY